MSLSLPWILSGVWPLMSRQSPGAFWCISRSKSIEAPVINKYKKNQPSQSKEEYLFASNSLLKFHFLRTFVTKSYTYNLTQATKIRDVKLQCSQHSSSNISINSVKYIPNLKKSSKHTAKSNLNIILKTSPKLWPARDTSPLKVGFRAKKIWNKRFISWPTVSHITCNKTNSVFHKDLSQMSEHGSMCKHERQDRSTSTITTAHD